jgi:hypothetical protein
MHLCGQLEERQGMTRLLIDDVNRLQGELGAGNPDPSGALVQQHRPTAHRAHGAPDDHSPGNSRTLMHLSAGDRHELDEVSATVAVEEPDHHRLLFILPSACFAGAFVIIEAISRRLPYHDWIGSTCFTQMMPRRWFSVLSSADQRPTLLFR